MNSSPGEDSNHTSLVPQFRSFILRSIIQKVPSQNFTILEYGIHHLTPSHTADPQLLTRLRELFPPEHMQISDNEVLPFSLLIFPMELWVDILTQVAKITPNIDFFHNLLPWHPTPAIQTELVNFVQNFDILQRHQLYEIANYLIILFTDYLYLMGQDLLYLLNIIRTELHNTYKYAHLIAEGTRKLIYLMPEEKLFIRISDRNRFLTSFPNIRHYFSNYGFLLTFYAITQSNNGVIPNIFDINYKEILINNNFDLNELRQELFNNPVETSTQSEQSNDNSISPCLNQNVPNIFSLDQVLNAFVNLQNDNLTTIQSLYSQFNVLSSRINQIDNNNNNIVMSLNTINQNIINQATMDNKIASLIEENSRSNQALINQITTNNTYLLEYINHNTQTQINLQQESALMKSQNEKSLQLFCNLMNVINDNNHSLYSNFSELAKQTQVFHSSSLESFNNQNALIESAIREINSSHTFCTEKIMNMQELLLFSLNNLHEHLLPLLEKQKDNNNNKFIVDTLEVINNNQVSLTNTLNILSQVIKNLTSQSNQNNEQRVHMNTLDENHPNPNSTNLDDPQNNEPTPSQELISDNENDPPNPPPQPPNNDAIPFQRIPIEQLIANITTPLELNNLINTWMNSHENEISYNSNRNSLLVQMILQKQFPSIGLFACPHPNCLTCKQAKNRATHLLQIHHQNFIDSEIPLLLESILHRDISWTAENTQFRPFFCLLCDYIGNERNTFKNHLAKAHKEINPLLKDFGPIWAQIIHACRNNLTIQNINYFTDDQNICICKNLDCIRRNRRALSIHISQTHQEARVQGEVSYIIDTTLSTNLNPPQIVNLSTPEQMVQEMDNNSSAQQTQESDLINHPNDSIALEVSNPQHEIQEPTNIEYPQETYQAMEKAMKWFNKYSKQIEKGSLSLPKITFNMKKEMTKEIKELFQNKIIPLIKSYRPRTQEQFIYFEGAILKCEHILYKYVLKKFKIKRNFDKKDNERLYNRIRKREFEEKALKDTSNLTTLLNEFKILNRTEPEYRNDTWNNNMANLNEQLLYISQNCNDEIIRNTFGERNMVNINNLQNQQEDWIDNLIKWLDSYLIKINDEKNNRRIKQVKKIQELYDEDPKKCLDYNIFPNVSPCFTIPKDETINFFNDSWAKEPSFLPSDDSLWNPPNLIDDENMEKFWDTVLNKKILRKVIGSRKSASAHGLDGLSNAVYSCAPKLASKYFINILRTIKLTRKFPQHWKIAKVVLLYKNKDPSIINNWRPISITSTAYRIIMTQFTNAFQLLNNEVNFLSIYQKGFIKNCNGCIQHAVTIQELINHAARNKLNIYIASIDLTNAFGEIPHKLIFNNLKHLGFKEDLIEILSECYKDSSNFLQTINFKSDKIPLRKGIKQGCPLSPLLFNIAIDPLIRIINSRFHGEGIENICIQAYADDIVLIANNESALNEMLKTMEIFCRYAHLKINANKCGIYSYLLENNRRVSTNTEFKIFNELIPNIHLLTLKEYLGAPIARSHVTKMLHSEAILKDISNKLVLIGESCLRFNQKLDAIRRFIIPCLDYELTCNNCNVNTLKQTNKLIRNIINKDLNAIATPIPLFHMNWKDGGLNIPDLTQRARVLTIKTFLDLNFWSSNRTMELFQKLTEDERTFRKIQKDDDDSRFFDWNINNLNNGTESLCIKTIKAVKKLELYVWKDEDGINIADETPLDTRTTTSSREFLKRIKKGLDYKWQENMTQMPLKGHSFDSLKNSACSSFFLSPRITKANNNVVKFAVNARCNNLPTGEIIAHGENVPKCTICNNGPDNIKHRLNACKLRFSKYKERHNAVVEDLIRFIDQSSNQQFTFHRSTSIKIPGMNQLELENQKLLPDIWFVDLVNNKLILIEVSIPYGCLTHINGNVISTLEKVTREKTNKYAALKEDCAIKTNLNVKFYPIIVSSLGAVPHNTFNCLKKLLKNDSKLTKVCARAISFSAIKGSALIYWNINNRQRNQLVASVQENQDDNQPAGNLVEPEMVQLN